MTRLFAATCCATLLLASSVAPVLAASDPAAKCAAAKLKAAGKKYASKAKCQATAVLKGEAVSADCMQKAETKFVQAFAKADSLGTCPGVAGDVESGIDVCLTDLVGQVVPTTTTTIVDSSPPGVASADDTSSTSVSVVFDEPIDGGTVNANGSDFVLDNGASVLSATLQMDGVTVVLNTSALGALVTYTVTVTGVSDLAGNAIMAPNNQAVFTRVPPAAVVRINEVNANIFNGCDLIELRVMSGGDLSNFALQERDTSTLVTFPVSFSVATNDLLIVHLNGASALCNPGGAPNETVSASQFPAAIYSGNYDTAYDFWVMDTGLAATDNVLTLYNGVGSIVEAVLLADDAAATVSASSETQAAAVAAANQWQIAGGGVPPGGFVDADFVQNAAQDLNGTGTSVSGDSIQRRDDTDDNDRLDWNVGSPTLPQTFGSLNAGQSLQ